MEFPFNAYDCQLVYMSKVISALQQGQNALLESPTGTGKTLCLLCATLSWRASLAEPSSSLHEENGASSELPSRSLPGHQREVYGLHPTESHGGGTAFQRPPAGGESAVGLGASQRLAGGDVQRRRLPTIIYASRTHSQLHQVIRELKATQYRPKMCILGSREQMCVHEELSNSLRGLALNQTCRSMVKARSCSHHTRTGGYVREHPDLGSQPIDIEDLVKIGKADGPCPYYLSRELLEGAEIVFMPYNYLIDVENRRSLSSIHWEDCVLIFDEAHNLESVCADAASVDLTPAMLAGCVSEANKCVELALTAQHGGGGGAPEGGYDADTYALLKGLLLQLETHISEMEIPNPEDGFTRPGSFIYDLLGRVNITHDTVEMLLDTIDHAVLLLSDEAANKGAKLDGGMTFRLQALQSALKLIFRKKDPTYSTSFKMHLSEGYAAKRSAADSRMNGRAAGAPKGKGGGRTLGWWCFNPGLAMMSMKALGVRSIILTSGTLSPLASYAHELTIPFDVKLENPHVIAPHQIWVGVVPLGPSGKALNSSYRTRDTVEYKLELGNAIVNFARIVPDGLLVFFPSYGVLESCIEAWKEQRGGAAMSVWDRIGAKKQLVIEPRESALFNQANDDFVAKLQDGSTGGAVFFAVCRGKVSEGLDFADRAGRGVIVTGIPYALKTDPKVRLKREYLNENCRAAAAHGPAKGLTGEEWYVQQALRSVNQAVGRVIRHRHDYGAIILADERFSHAASQQQMSLWLRPHIRSYSRFGDAAFSLTSFFRDKGPSSAAPAPANGGGSSKILAGMGRQQPAESVLPAEPSQQPKTALLLSQPGVSQLFAALGSGPQSRPGLSAGPRQAERVSEILATRRQLSKEDPAPGASARVAAAHPHLRHQSPVPTANGSAPPGGGPQAVPATSGPASGHREASFAVASPAAVWSTGLRQEDEVLRALRRKAAGGSKLGMPLVGRKEDFVPRPTAGGASAAGGGEAARCQNGAGCSGPALGHGKEGHDAESEGRLAPPGGVVGVRAACLSEGGESHLSATKRARMSPEAASDARGAAVGCAGGVEHWAAADQRSDEEPQTRAPHVERKGRASDFLVQVKAALGAGEFTAFLRAMRSYKLGTVPVGDFVAAVAGIFLAASQLPLLERFGEFLKPEQRPLLDRHLARRPGRLEQTMQGTADGHWGSQVSPAQCAIPWGISGDQSMPESLVSGQVAGITGSATPANCRGLPAGQHSLKDIQRGGIIEGGVATARSDAICSYCRQPWKKPWESPCGHVCCFLCWEAMGSHKACPTCNTPLRRRELRELPFG